MTDQQPHDDRSGEQDVRDNADVGGASPRMEQIVAYLDGELTAKEAAAVERLLATDESYRRELQSLDRTWAALAELPALTIDERFARTTMELAVDFARQEVEEKTQALPIVRRRRRLGGVAAACIAAVGGFALTRLALPNPNADLLADLPIIHNVEIYSQLRAADQVDFDAIEFLRLLNSQADELFAEPLPPGTTSSPPPSDPAQRQAWLERLSAEGRTTLRAKTNRFRALGEEQSKSRELHQQIATAESDGTPLIKTLYHYQSWLASVSPAQQFELRSLPTRERFEKVCEWSAQRKADAPLQLSEEQLDKLFTAMREVLIETPPGHAPPRGTRRPRRFIDETLDDQSPPSARLQAVLDALPENARNAFILLPREQRYLRLSAWWRQAGAFRGEITQQELEQFFVEDLDVHQREELLLLPTAEQLQEALLRLYRSASGGATWPDPGPFSPFDRRPPDRRSIPRPPN